MTNILTKYTHENEKGSMTYYTNTLSGDRETILMLHPAFGDHEIFIRQIEAFHSDYNLVLVDFPGHGLSRIKGSSLNLGMVPSLINEILGQLYISKVHVLGVSLGSLIGQGLADQFPQLVQSLTVVGGYSIHKDNEDVLRAQQKEMLRWVFYLIFSMKKFRNHLVEVSASSPEGRKYMSSGVSKISRSTFLTMNGMNSLFRKTDEDKTYPLLVAVGEYDQPIAHTSAQKLSALPHAKYYLVKEAGHCANIDNYKDFNANYLDFIKSLT